MARTKAKLTTRQKESRRINRKRALRQWWQSASRRLTLLCIIVTSLAVSTSSWWLWHSGKLDLFSQNVSSAFWQKTADAGFRVEDIYLEGRKFTEMDEVTKALNVHIGDPILAIPLEQTRQHLQAIPRVKYAEIARVLPNQLHIRIEEREPIAAWQNDNKIRLVDEDGVVMEYVDPAKYPSLLVIVGEDAPQHFHELLTIFASEPDITRNVASAIRVGERRWNIRFKNGLELKLPEQNAAQAWQKFARMEKDDHILARAVKSVDMRLTDRIFIKAIPQETTPDKSGGSET